MTLNRIIAGLFLLKDLTVTGQCACRHGTCERDGSCTCYAGFTGSDCAQELCGGGTCIPDYTCFENQCCSATECFPPAVAESLMDDIADLPTAAYVGIGFIFLLLVAIVMAIVVVKRRPSRQPVSADETEDNVSKFVPAADITSNDTLGNVINTWERTKSKAYLEAADYVIPYKAESHDSNEKIAFEKTEGEAKQLEQAEKTKEQETPIDDKPKEDQTKTSKALTKGEKNEESTRRNTLPNQDKTEKKGKGGKANKGKKK